MEPGFSEFSEFRVEYANSAMTLSAKVASMPASQLKIYIACNVLSYVIGFPMSNSGMLAGACCYKMISFNMPILVQDINIP